MDDVEGHPLLAVYLARREELVRYFRIRLRSAEAAEDLVQDIYLKIAARPVTGAPEEIGNPGAYLYRLGSNLMLDRIKQQRRADRRHAEWQDSETMSAGGEPVDQAPPADEAVAARQRLDQILETVGAMSPSVREAFRLHKLEGLSHAETARAMGVSRSSVEKHIMASLRQILKRIGR
ncbi:MAG: RNA polymerase sigma factor [Caulobacter sp.]|nr:RNA polymerase sigma factor [Caulobacter sp.]